MTDQQTNVTNTHNRDAIILAWIDAKKALDAAKDAESKAREAAIALFGELKKGTNNLPLGNGYKLVAKKDFNYIVKKDPERKDYSNVMAVLAQLPSETANSLLRWEAKLSISTYNTLTAAERELVNTFVLQTDKTATLEFVEPKVKK